MDRGSEILLGFGVGLAASAVVVGGIYLLKSRRGAEKRPLHRKNQTLTEARRHLKLYHSFPFRSSRCAWVINELGINEFVEIVPVSLHGPDAKDLPKYKKEVCVL